MSTSAQNNMPPPQGPPYEPRTAVLGGYPNVDVDVPITAVFIFLFLLAAAGHMTIFIRNNKQGHKFLISGAMFGFCMARNLACVMRIVWAAVPGNVSVVIAAQLFAALGDLFGYVINLIFTQRILRAAFPHFGWRKSLHWAFISLYLLLAISVCLLIGFTVAAFYTLDRDVLNAARDVSIYGPTVFGFVVVLPLFILPATLTFRNRAHEENFGTGSLLSKVYIVLFCALTLAIGQWYRTATTYKNPRPKGSPAAYQSRGPFYVFYFTLDVVVIVAYLLLRIDKRFWVPNGSKGPGDYLKEGENGEKTSLSDEESVTTEVRVTQSDISLVSGRRSVDELAVPPMLHHIVSFDSLDMDFEHWELEEKRRSGLWEIQERRQSRRWEFEAKRLSQRSAQS